MRLTRFTDYSLRVLIYVGLRPDRLVTIDEIAKSYGISRNHLMKVVFSLGQSGYLETVRGNRGGMQLARRPELIVIGSVIRQIEGDFGIVECLQETDRACIVAPACMLKSAMIDAVEAFLSVFDRYTLADLIEPKRKLALLLGIPAS